MLTAHLSQVLPEFGFAPRVGRLVDAVLAAQPEFRARTLYPALNVWESEQAYTVEAELPGYALADLDITVLGGELTLAGKRAAETPPGTMEHRRERHSGTFSRSVRFGAEVDEEHVSARLESGVLTITLPKAPSARPRKIDVTPA